MRGVLLVLLASSWLLDILFLRVAYDSWKFCFSVWSAHDGLSFWVSILSTYKTEERSEWVDSSHERFELNELDLPLKAFMFTSLEMALTSIEWFIAKLIGKEFMFAIFLLDTTIQDGGMKERSNASLLVT